MEFTNAQESFLSEVLRAGMIQYFLNFLLFRFACAPAPGGRQPESSPRLVSLNVHVT